MTEAELKAAGLPPLPEGILPFESWEKLKGESAAAYSAFCSYRDYGAERNIRRAAVTSLTDTETGTVDTARVDKRYRMWRGWSAQYRWRERAADYDQYLDRLKRTKKREAIEALGERQNKTAEKILDTVDKKLDSMTPQDLSPGLIVPLMETVGRVQRELREAETVTGGKDSRSEPEPGSIQFIPEFEGL
jgi:hypothetical protein